MLPLAIERIPPADEALRPALREFLAREMPPLDTGLRSRSWMGYDAEFSRKLGQAGFLGLTMPRRYGGGERGYFARFVVVEELLSAGAPISAHWIADRQSAPQILRYGTEAQRERYLPLICRGEAFFCIGMSEPDSGSDLASIRSRATLAANGWVINGRKVWTSGAHRCHYMIALLRTSDRGENRHAGMSQFLIDMKTPGITVRPIVNQLGEHDFNEVTFDDVLVPHENLLGKEGEGWRNVGTELAFERSGPERYLSSTQLLLEMLAAADPANPRHAVELGRVVAQYGTLREMSLGVAAMLARGENPALAAAAVKDQGALVEQKMPEIAHDLFGGLAEPGSPLAQAMTYITLAVPSFSLRGGTREILRGIIAKGMDLR